MDRRLEETTERRSAMLATLAIDLLYVSGIMITCGWAADVLHAGVAHYQQNHTRLASSVVCPEVCRK